MAKTTYYFSHDCNASQDPKILEMCLVYKAEGYGWYWMLIEMMSEQNNYKLSINGKYAFSSLATHLYANYDVFLKYIDDCVENFKLFNKNKKYLWSDSLIKRMQYRDEKSEKARQSAQKRWNNKPEKNANALRDEYEGNASSNANVSENDANAMLLNEIKGNEIILSQRSKFSDEGIEIKLAKELYSGMIENNPGSLEPNFQTWAKNIDLMLRVDKRNIEDIRKIINFSQHDSFWKSNILSTAKLREKFDQLILKANSVVTVHEEYKSEKEIWT